MQWASLKSSYSRFYMARRLETIHTFAVYVSAFDNSAQIPQIGVFGKCHGRVAVSGQQLCAAEHNYCYVKIRIM